MKKSSSFLHIGDLAKIPVLVENVFPKNGAIPFEVNFTKELVLNVEDLANGAISEGIDVKIQRDVSTGKVRKEVSFNPSHNKGIDTTSTKKSLDAPKVIFQDGKIQVYSILKRTALDKAHGDGNPLVYAMKSERGFYFKSKKDQDVITAIVDELLEKFFKDFNAKINSEDVTAVMLPSGNALNSKFAKHIQKVAEKVGMHLTLNDGVLVKMTVDDFISDVYDDVNSSFGQWLYSLDDASIDKYESLLDKYLDEMRKNHNNLFSYHFIKEPDLRNHISRSMKIGSDYVDKKNYSGINGENILLLDDTISRGASLAESASLICDNFTPKTISALTLFSALHS